MTTDVVSLDARRAARSSSAAHRCPCGGEWFRPVGHDDQPPAVTLSSSGSITGYAGTIVCNTCERTQK